MNLRLRPYSMLSMCTAVRAQAFFKQRACSGALAFVSQNSQSRVRAHSFKKSESQTEVSS